MLNVYKNSRGEDYHRNVSQTSHDTISLSLSASRLQISDEVEVLSPNPLLYRYTNVWRNPHWFSSVHTIYPTTALQGSDNIRSGSFLRKAKDCPTSRQLNGAKLMQESLVYYVLDSSAVANDNIASVKLSLEQKSLSSVSNTRYTSIATDAIVDICSQLLDASTDSSCGRKANLQAILETKQLSAFLTPTEAYLLKSPRSLRRILWQQGLNFASVFGHSSDTRPSVNLSREDLSSLTDSRANFPGCVRWKSIIDGGSLSDKARRSVDRLRDLLHFQGVDEVRAFLQLLQTEVLHRGCGCEEVAASVLTQHPLAVSPAAEIFDPSCTKRLLANFPFRGGQLGSSQLLWSTILKDGGYSLRLKCALTPMGQAAFVHGVSQLVGSFRVKFKLSQGTLEAWRSLIWDICSTSGSFGIPSELIEACPDVANWLIERVPTESVADGHPRVLLEPDNIASCERKAITEKPWLSQQVDNASPLMITAAEHCNEATDVTSKDANVVSCAGVLIENTVVGVSNKIEGQPPNSMEKTTRESLHLPPKLSINSRRVSGVPLVKVARRKVGPAPSLASRRRATTSLVTTVVMPRKVARVCSNAEKNVLNFLRPSQRSAVVSMGKYTVLFVGEFPFAPLSPSICVEEAMSSIPPQVFSLVDYLIVSSSTCMSTMEKLAVRMGSFDKIKSLYWFSYHTMHANSGNDVTDYPANSNYSSVLPILSPILTSPCVKYLDTTRPSSRNVFLVVPDAVTADLVAPLSRQPPTRVLLDAGAIPLRNWLLQMGSKQAQWEEAAMKLLTHQSIMNNEKAQLIRQCPNFRVHVLVILPCRLQKDDDDSSNRSYCSELEMLPTDFCRRFSSEVTSNILWSRIRRNILQLMELQKQYPYTPPTFTAECCDTATSRLSVWLLPLNYLELCYASCRLLEGGDLRNYALEYEDNTTTFRLAKSPMTAMSDEENGELLALPAGILYDDALAPNFLPANDQVTSCNDIAQNFNRVDSERIALPKKRPRNSENTTPDLSVKILRVAE